MREGVQEGETCPTVKGGIVSKNQQDLKSERWNCLYGSTLKTLEHINVLLGGCIL